MRQHWAGFGGGGLTVSYEIIRGLYKNNYIQDFEKENKIGNPPPTPDELTDELERSGNEKSYYPYLESAGENVQLAYYGMDTDSRIMSSLRDRNEQHYEKFLAEHAHYFTIVKQLDGDGTGAIPEKISSIADETPLMQDWINSVLEDGTGQFMPMFSLDGGSGFGFFKEHVNLMDREQILTTTDTSQTKVTPLAITPHRSDADRRCVWEEAGIERNALDNTLLATEFLEDRLESGLLDFCIVVDNDLAAYNALCDEESRKYDTVANKLMPIIVENDFERFYKDIPSLDYDLANRGIVNSVFPLTMMFLSGPRGVKFGKVSMDGFDITDMHAFFKSNFVIPSYTEITHRQEVNQIFEDYAFETVAEELAYLAYYTFLLSNAPFDGDDVRNIKVFIWTDRTEQGIGEDVRSEVESLMSGIGVSGENITVDPVVGINDPNSMTKIWTLTGAEQLTPTYREKFIRS